MIYDRPVSGLMRDAAAQLTPPFAAGDFVTWFAERYPKIKASTVKAHVAAMTANNPNRHNSPYLAAKAPLFFRSAQGSLERFDPDVHIDEEALVDTDGGADLDDMEHNLDSPEATEFVLEAHLEEFLLGNWKSIQWGRPLELWTGLNGETGHQFHTSVGILDFLCRDPSSHALVVVELKRGKPSDCVVGQIARYMGWVRHHIAVSGQLVEGIIVAHDYDENLRYAAMALPGLSVFAYAVTFSLHAVDAPAQLEGSHEQT
jgi:hypothetical protein